MLRVLLIAPTCDGNDVGEAWVAYQWARLLADRVDLTVLTYFQRGHQPASAQLPGVRVIEWSEPPVVARAARLNSMIKPGYLPFYVRARRWIKRAVMRGEHFDVAHQPAPVAMRYPSPVAGLGVPYLIGPVGGSLPTPPAFRAGETAPWFVALRRVDDLRLAHDPLLRRTYSGAACVLGIAQYVRDMLRSVPLKRFAVMSETGLESVPDRIQRDASARPLALLFVGRLVRTKGVRDAIRAMGDLADLPVHLDIVGDGYDRDACEALIVELSLGDRVTMHGRIPRADVDGFYRRADVFVFPSYREAGGNVLWEAMGFGLPMVVSDRGGPASAVTDDAGFRIPVTTPDQFASDLASAVRRLALDPELRKRLGDGARARAVDAGLWTTKVDRMLQLYKSI